MTSSDRTFAPPSTMTMASRDPATSNCNSLSGYCDVIGFTTSCPPMRPMRTPAIGPLNGMSETSSAADAPMSAGMSASFSLSNDSTVATIWVSQRKPSGKSGRSGRSIRRELRISFSLCRPSRLKNPPGILPAAKVFSW